MLQKDDVVTDVVLTSTKGDKPNVLVGQQSEITNTPSAISQIDAADRNELTVKSQSEIVSDALVKSISLLRNKYPIVRIIDGDLNNLPTVVTELANIRPPDHRAFHILKKRILRDGAVDPLIVAEINGELILLDGHMRLEIFKQENVTHFKMAVIELPSIEAAICYVVEQSFSYRHLNDFLRLDIAEKGKPYYDMIAKENKRLAGKYKDKLADSGIPFEPIDCTKTIAENAQVSEETLRAYRYIMKNGKPNDIQQCREGEVKIHTMQKNIRDRIEDTEEWNSKRNGANDDVQFDNPKVAEFYGQVIQGNCLQVLEDMEYHQIRVDLGIFSPMYYGAQKDYGPDYKEFASYDEYLFFLAQLIYKFQKIGNIGMRLCIVVDSMNNTKAKSAGDFMYPVNSDLVRIVHELNAKNEECNLRYMGDFIWYKNHAGGKIALGSYSPMGPVIRNDAESIHVWVKGQKKFTDINEHLIVQNCENPKWLITKDEYHEFTRKTWKIAPNTDKYRHPAKFPYDIPYRLIKLLSFPSQVVCDPVCGSGVTLKAAKDLGRKFIGVDQNPAFCQMSLDRLAEGEEVQHEKA